MLTHHRRSSIVKSLTKLEKADTTMIQLLRKPYCSACNDLDEKCQECCQHEFDSSEGGMCLNCDMEGHEGSFDEDYGQER